MAARSPQPLKAVQMISEGNEPSAWHRGTPTASFLRCRRLIAAKYTPARPEPGAKNLDHLKPQEVSFHELKRSPRSHSQISRCPLMQRTLGPNVPHKSGSIGWNDPLPGEERRPAVG